MRETLAVAAILALAACPPPPDQSVDAGPDGGGSSGGLNGGTGGGLSLASVTPAQGPLDGGTKVTLTGTGFGQGMTVAFGASPQGEASVSNAFQATAVTPPASAAGSVDVTIALDGTVAVLHGGFSYLAATVPDGGPPVPIQWCDLQFPTALTVAPGASSGPVYGQVYSSGVTTAAGNQADFLAEVGYGGAGSDPGDAGWSWFAAGFNPSCTDCNGGHNYEYQGSFAAPDAGVYALAYRFSADRGASWTDCGANPPGVPYSPANAGTLTVAVPDGGDGGSADGGFDAGLSIGWCDLQFPASLTVAPGASSGLVYGQVFVSGVTTVPGNQADFEAQVGYGEAGSDPADAGWSWFAATFNASCTDCNGGHNYEYQASFTAPDAGVYALAYRFSADQGTSWTDCGTNPPGVPYGPANAGVLTVAGPDGGPDGGADAGQDAGATDGGGDAGPAPVPITWCDLQFPKSLAVEPGASSGLVYAQVYAPGVTTVPGHEADFEAQIGYGPPGSDPADAGWIWSAAAFNPSCSDCNGGQNYEYDGTFIAPAAGSYAMAARFSGDQGASWTDCDGVGIPYNPANEGTLSVRWPAVGWCNLQFPPFLDGGTPGIDAGPVYGRVLLAGVTDDGGSPSAILAEVGLGPVGGDPTDADAGWLWWPSVYNPGCLLCGPNYEYQGWIVPPDAGVFAYVTRFSVDDGGYWTVCGLGGPWNPDGGSDAGLLAVP
ncbi:MAG: IPT/TIG domain-containing protein [Myxococcales bacterium]